MAAHSSAKLSACGRWLDVDLCVPHATLGWTLIGGGRARARCAFWYSVSGADLGPQVDAKRFFEDRRKEHAGNAQGVGFLTGCKLADFVEKQRDSGALSVRCIATVGLANALRIGDPPCATTISPGTINILLQTSCPLSEAASIEALSLVAEARTLAVLEARVASSIGHAIATGTGTDCIVVASPLPCSSDPEAVYSGKHTVLGHLIGSCVYDAVSHGIRQSGERALL
jgi:adenosylcobinamide amidohydrolase